MTRVLVRLGCLAALAMAIALGVNLWRTASLNSSSSLLAAGQALAHAHAGMLDQETGLRAYLDTGESTFLQPYRIGQQEVSQGDDRLQGLIAGEPELLGSFVDLRLAQDRWVSNWANQATIQTQRADVTSFLQDGKALFDSYRVREVSLAASLDDRLAASQAASGNVSLAELLLEGVVAVAGMLLFWRSRQRLRRAVIGPVSVILRDLERIHSGDFTSPETVASGPAELCQITGRLAAIAVTLQSARDAMLDREREAAEHAARLRGIVDMGREIAGSLNLRYVLQAVSHSVLGIGCGSRCVIWLTDDSHGTLVPVHDSAGIKGRIVGLAPIAIGDQAIGKAARFGRLVGPEAVSHPSVPEPWSHALAVPMIVGARVVGVIEAGSNHAVELPTALMELIDTLSSQAATAIEAARLYERAEQEGRTDALTLLPNRRDLDSALGAEVSRAERYGRSLSVAMLDLDHFKRVNDTHGHARGDEVLQETAAVMRNVLRDVDTIYRYGGEEFLLVMPETNSESAVELCNRLRAAVSDRVVLPTRTRLTISCGVAAFPDQAADPASLIAAADGALYRAKRAGRDRVVAAEADDSDPASSAAGVLPQSA